MATDSDTPNSSGSDPTSTPELGECCELCGVGSDVLSSTSYYEFLCNECLAEESGKLESDRAYDGSNEPQKRPLTARERDILCRILGDILNAMPVIYYTTERDVLVEVRHVLDPRVD